MPIHNTIGTNIKAYDIPIIASLVNPVDPPTATICSDTTSTNSRSINPSNLLRVPLL